MLVSFEPQCLLQLIEDSSSGVLPARIAEGIQRAAGNLAAARVGWAVVGAPEHNYCRRWITRPDKVRLDPFGHRTVRAMMHPGWQNPDFPNYQRSWRPDPARVA